MQRFAYPLLVAAGIVLVFWKITLSGQFTWMNGDDIVQQVLPWFQMQAREWHRGHFPLLDPFHWAGQSLIGQTQPGALFPLNWLLFALPLKHGRLQTPILNGYFVFIHILGGWGMYGLARLLRLGRPAAALAAIAFGAGGFMATVDWPQMLNGAVFLPVTLYFWIRFLRAPGRMVFAALAGAAGGASVLAGHHSGPVMILAAVAGVTAFRVFETRKTRAKMTRFGVGIALFCTFFALLSAAQALPAAEYWRVSLRFVNAKEPVTFDQQIPYMVHRHYSLDAASLPGLLVNGYYRDAALNPFLGVTLFALAVIGAGARRARWLVFLAVFSMLLAMGEGSLLHGLFFAGFPMFDKLRNPSMLILNVHLALILLAGMGLEMIARSGVVRWLAWGGGAALALVTVLYAIEPAKAMQQQGLAMAGLFSLALAACHRWPVVVALLVVAEIGANSTKGYPDREMGFANFENLSRYDDVAGYLLAERKAAPFRTTIDDSVALKNFGDWYGIEQVNGYMGMSINMFREQWRPEVPALLGARFHVGEKPRLADQVKRFTGRAGVSVWESTNYAPFVWTAHRWERVTEGELAERYQRGWNPLFALAGEPRLAECAGADVTKLTDLRPEYARIEAAMACDGVVVYSTAVLPGWSVTVDGRPAPLLEAYGKLTAVAVQAGAHTVEFRYAPGSVKLGAGLTLLGLALAAGWWWISRRR